MLLSLCMLTLNEANHVPVSLPSVLPFVDEVVVIDGGSVDHTVDILRTLGPKIKVTVVPQEGDPYTPAWQQEERRQQLQELCQGEWIIQLDADEVVSDNFSEIRDLISKADERTECFSVWRIDYIADLYHGFMPYICHTHIPRIWRKGAVDWRTGRALHMFPYRTGTQQAIHTFPEPVNVKTDIILHHLHRAFWIGKGTHKRRIEEQRRPPLSRSSTIGNYKWTLERLTDPIVPSTIKKLRSGQKDRLADQLGIVDDFATFDPSQLAVMLGAPFCDRTQTR